MKREGGENGGDRPRQQTDLSAGKDAGSFTKGSNIKEAFSDRNFHSGLGTGYCIFQVRKVYVQQKKWGWMFVCGAKNGEKWRWMFWLCGGERDGRNVQTVHPYRKSLSRPYIDKVHFNGHEYSQQGMSMPLMINL